MGVDLYKHNAEAYAAALAMLAETGKAAVVHPTGTGKSFIGFKLCEENPDKIVCWLSPSEYIFQTQLENLRSAAEGYEPENIRFYTYAKLMNMTSEDIAEIQPDCIILDEFHRAGAEQWGQGVQRLLSAYPGVPILGLSATAVRYLDNQRDMSDELFDGNVASEMTLGEAIVRGILNPPKYVLSVFSYQKDLEKYQRRVRQAKNKAVRDAGEEYLEALRRALDKADGLDVIFDKHMTDRHGKYIVFCANYDHLCEMADKAPQWFARVDDAPHIYSAYSDDPETSRAFAEFKADTSDHLKLLYCIDMLNEGIHVDDISGVILLRPTVSPIIYKQQIGRALSASKKTDAVIFDIVLNIENLYSIDSLEAEMQNAVLYFRGCGLDADIVNEHFRVIDEVRDCRELFDRLNDTLSLSWELMYGYAKQYYEENGSLNVSKRYKTADGYSLGSWITIQRRVYAGEINGRLTQSQVERLNAIGMIWDSRMDILWNQGYAELLKYKEEHGNLDIESRYITKEGFALGRLVANIRSAKVQGLRSTFLTPEHERMLTELGFIWDKLDYAWEQYYLACAKFKLENGHLHIPADALSEDGLAIGVWVRRQRLIRSGAVEGRLTESQITRLEELGFSWEDHQTKRWNDAYERLVEYKKSNGHVRVLTTYVDGSGFALGKWLKRQKDNPKLSDERKARLAELGVSFAKTDSWEIRYALAEKYYREHGDLNVPPDYTAEGIWLAKWLSDQRQICAGNRKGKTLTQEQIARLNAIGMAWENRTQLNSEAVWQEQFGEAKRFYEENGHLNVPMEYRTESGKKLALWLSRQRKRYLSGKLAEEKVRQLESIGMVFGANDPWEVGFAHAKAYADAHGNLMVPHDYVSPDGYNLGTWISNQKNYYRRPTKYHSLTEKQAERLEKIGIVWNTREQKWLDGFRHAREYAETLNGGRWATSYVSPDGFKTGEWLRSQQRRNMRCSLDADKSAMLAGIGFVFQDG